MNTTTAILPLLVLLCSFALAGAQPDEKFSLEDQTKALVAGNNAFAVDLYRQIRSASANLVFSPFSISDCLAMNYAGARGNTEKQMAQVLHFGTNQVHSAFGEIGRRLREAQNRSGIELSMANGMWLQKGPQLLPAFMDIVHREYDAEVRQFDFVKEAQLARADISVWVNQKTKGRLQASLLPSMVNSTTEMVLVNAIFFKGTWKTKFNPRSTQVSDFHLGAGRKVQCPTMACQGKFPYYEQYTLALSCKILELPYAGREFSFFAILPAEVEGLAALERSLTDASLASLMASVQESEVLVSLPKFTLETGLTLENTLPAMGMSAAFGVDADFSGIDGTKSLFISFIQHQAYVEINEEGTTAAAVTGSFLTRGKAEPVTYFTANHPFLFAIRDNLTGSILFMGRVTDPSKS
jgi:serpin B